MGRLFGTDGVRGLANADLTPELALSLAVAAAHVLAESHLGHRPVAVVGRDPRASGEMLEAAVVAGLTSAGANVLRAGVLPTPAVAHLTHDAHADLGIMLSASHNPMPDNGIKLFDRDGNKLADAVEDAIEARMGETWTRPTGAGLGRVADLYDGQERYLEHLLTSLPHPLDGLTLVVDCANGAASGIGPEAYRRAGAEVITIHATPDGENINDNCGSTHLDDLQAAVRKNKADVGIAHDGDADRCLAVAADGSVVDGDAILAILAVAQHEVGALAGGAVVTTVMTNLGFKKAMTERGIDVVETPVGDRYVLEAMRERNLNLGGEQSGHVIFREHSTTGDGILTALHLLARVAQTKQSLADLASVMHRLPQVLVNVTAERSRAADVDVVAAVADVENELGEGGRVLVRPSGTEPLVRVMVEAQTAQDARKYAERLAALIAPGG